MPQAEKGTKKSSSKCRRCKSCFRTIGDKRYDCEVSFRKCFPHSLEPCVTCFCVTSKFVILESIAGVILPFLCGLSCISCLARCCGCAHGQDCVYSALECQEVVEDSVDLYMDVQWWRQKRGDLVDEPGPKSAKLV